MTKTVYHTEQCFLKEPKTKMSRKNTKRYHLIFFIIPTRDQIAVNFIKPYRHFSIPRACLDFLKTHVCLPRTVAHSDGV